VLRTCPAGAPVKSTSSFSCLLLVTPTEILNCACGRVGASVRRSGARYRGKPRPGRTSARTGRGSQGASSGSCRRRRCSRASWSRAPRTSPHGPCCGPRGDRGAAAVGPPDRTAFAQRNLRGIDRIAGQAFGAFVERRFAAPTVRLGAMSLPTSLRCASSQRSVFEARYSRRRPTMYCPSGVIGGGEGACSSRGRTASRRLVADGGRALALILCVRERAVCGWTMRASVCSLCRWRAGQSVVCNLLDDEADAWQAK
jgi:hypothetical protein